mgnify:CR=1 FL=1
MITTHINSSYTLNDYFLPRGFANIYVSGLGTKDSQGQMTNGDYCEVISPKQEIKKDAPAFVVTPTVEGINCAGVNSGKILFNNANISGGVAPYTIEFNNGLTTVTRPVGDITGLA